MLMYDNTILTLLLLSVNWTIMMNVQELSFVVW